MSGSRWYLHNLSTGKALLIEEELVVGRTWMTLAHDRGLSRKHFQIRIQARFDSNGRARSDQITLMDLGSTHGTRINSSLLPPNEEFLVNPTDLILAGHQTFRVHTSAVLPDRGNTAQNLGFDGVIGDNEKSGLKIVGLVFLAITSAWIILGFVFENGNSPISKMFDQVSDRAIPVPHE